MSKIAKEIAREFIPNYMDAAHSARLESIVDAKLEEFHRTMKMRLRGVEHALDTRPKWTDNTSPKMTQEEALMMVRCVIDMLKETEHAAE